MFFNSYIEQVMKKVTQEYGKGIVLQEVINTLADIVILTESAEGLEDIKNGMNVILETNTT